MTRPKWLMPVVLSVTSVTAGVLVNQFVRIDGSEVRTATQTTAFGGSTNSDPIPNNIFVSIAKELIPSVVNISTWTNGGPQGMREDEYFDFFDNFRRQRPRQSQPRPMALGTGFVIDSEGLILTNNHVVEQADEIQVRFTEETSEKPTRGEVVGRDPELDLALIRVKTNRKLTPVKFGDSDALEVGEYVMAAGNPFGQGHSVSHGIISAKGRPSPDIPLAKYLQTDAPINPGNSGGPLVNLRGEVIGINNAIDARAQGIGFAIPINSVKAILGQLKAKGSVARGGIGVVVGPMDERLARQLGVDKELEAPVVTAVAPGGPADKAGMKPYDVIKEFNGRRVRTPTDLHAEVRSVGVGTKVKAIMIREGKDRTIELTVGNASELNASNAKRPSRAEPPRKSRIDTGMVVETLDTQLAARYGHPGNINGAVVIDLQYEGAAAKAGLRVGDLILEVNQKQVSNQEAFEAEIISKKSYLLRIRRPLGPEGNFLVIVLDLSGDT